MNYIRLAFFSFPCSFGSLEKIMTAVLDVIFTDAVLARQMKTKLLQDLMSSIHTVNRLKMLKKNIRNLHSVEH